MSGGRWKKLPSFAAYHSMGNGVSEIPRFRWKPYPNCPYSGRIKPSVQSCPQGGGTGRDKANRSVARHSRVQTAAPSPGSLAA